LQFTQAPWQLVLQQTPSAQKPDSHSFAALQVAPSGFCPQLPPVQARGDAHWPSAVHISKHRFVVVSQPKGAHTVVAPATQAPLWHERPPTTDAP
jgi:hypothetical protein